MKFFILFSLINRLGIYNIFLQTRYKFLKNIGFYKLRSVIYRCPEIHISLKKTDDFEIQLYDKKIISCADNILEDKFLLFSFFIYKFDQNYLWVKDPFSEKTINNKFHWSDTNFYKNIDIKNIWEMSRWQWFSYFSDGLENECK